MSNNKLHLTKGTSGEITTLPRVGLYTCPMCQGRGVCSTKSVSDFEGNFSRLSKTYRCQGTAATGSLEQDDSWLPLLADLSDDEGLRQSHPASKVCSMSEPWDCGAFDPSIPPSLPSAILNHTVTVNSQSSSSKKLTHNKHLDKRLEEIWPGINERSGLLTRKPKHSSTFAINIKDMPRELPKAIYTREDVVQGLQGVVQISRWQPGLIEPYMAVINRAVLSLLRGLRSHATRLACQAAGELFRTMQCTNRPEFDELVGALLARTADLNRFIRQDANVALDAMVTYLPPQACVRALLAKGCSHKHPLVRSATARLLTCCSVLVGPGGLLAQCTKKDARSSLLSGAAALLGDPNQQTRSIATKLFESLVQHEHFDAIFQSSVDDKLANKVEKAITLIKYNKHASRS